MATPRFSHAASIGFRGVARCSPSKRHSSKPSHLDMGIQNDVQKLEPGDKVTLFEIDATAFGGDLLRFHPHAQSEPIIWQGQPYSPWPVSVSGFSRSGETKQATPSLSVSNLDGTISAMCAALDDLVGARVLRHCTLAKYLDAANFPNGNPTADPNEEMPVELWFIEQKTADTGDEVTFELSSPLAFGGRQLPNSA
ncbi:phage minor tail protein L, partial [Chitinasiproducens palmae]